MASAVIIQREFLPSDHCLDSHNFQYFVFMFLIIIISRINAANSRKRAKEKGLLKVIEFCSPVLVIITARL